MSDFGEQLLRESSSANDVATFVAKFAQENLNLFMRDMKQAFPNAKIGAKTNV